MIVVHNESNVSLFWSIFKGVSTELEDFSRSILKVFIISSDNKWPVEYEAQRDGRLKIELPTGLAPDVYGVEAVWAKNFNRFKEARLTDCICHAEVKRAFAVTDVLDEATNNGSVKISIRSQVATYGHDGMNAYEMCVLYGKWGTSLQEWLDSKLGQMVTTEQMADGAITPAKLSEELLETIDLLEGGLNSKAEQSSVYDLYTKLGVLASLTTVEKRSLVGAINEINAKLDKLWEYAISKGWLLTFTPPTSGEGESGNFGGGTESGEVGGIA